jgi:transcriptional regulator with XRE-family HTH domain
MSVVEAFRARLRRGMNITRLAEAIDVQRHSIAVYEAGEFAPQSERIRQIARALKFPERFFFGSDLRELEPKAASFRSLSKLAAGQRDMALGSAAIAVALNQWIEGRYVLPEAKLPDLGRHASLEGAAETMQRAAQAVGRNLRTEPV